MTAGHAVRRSLIWATRGRTWGFRFLLDAGLDDPLATYERSFSNLGDDPTAFGRQSGGTALRFPDPQGRRDAAGRPIPHELVVLDAAGLGITSLEDGVALLWPVIERVYADVWDLERAPTAEDVALGP